MNNRFWLGLFLLTLSMFASSRTATAQTLQIDFSHGNGLSAQPPSKQSHHDLPGGLDLDHPEEMMAQRLRELHELHQLQDQVQGLLNDPEFLKNIPQLNQEQIRQLRENLLKGEGLHNDPSWDKLLKHARSQNKLNQQQIEILRRLTERAERNPPPSSERGLPNSDTNGAPATPSVPTPGSLGPSPSTPAANSPEPTLLDRMQEETTKWMMEHLDDVGGDVLEALSGVGMTEDGAPLAELLRSLDQSDFSDLYVSVQAMDLWRYVPNMGQFLHEQRGAWSEVRSLFHDAPVPSLPSFGGSSVSLPSAPGADSGSTVPALLSLLLLAVVVLLLSRMAARSQNQAGSREENWRLGPWPVAPNAVSTRQDLIRAFEYLALLSLGLAAHTCHHRELAERLAEQDSGNPARRQAAEMLAWLYEQARYAPPGEPLSPEEMSDARHALCCLAGVTAS